MTLDHRRPLVSPVSLLALVAFVYAVVALVATESSRFFSWDEAVYASEVSPLAQPISLAAHRARGITLVVAPILQVTESMSMIRIYLIVLFSLGLFLAFLPWTNVIGWRAAVGAAVFGTSWLSLFYASEVMPNLLSALAVVASLGLVAAYMAGSSRALLLGAVAAAAVVSFVRPLDGGITVACAAMIPLVFRSRELWRAVLAVAIGFTLGFVPWLVEAWVRFGGPLSRLEMTRRIVGGGPTNNVDDYVFLADGPLVGPDPNSSVTAAVAVWLLVLVGLALAGGLFGQAERRTALFVLVSAALFAIPYLAFSEASAPRFLLPALALLSLAAGIGLGWASSWTSLQPTVVALVVLALLALNLGTLSDVSTFQTRSRDTSKLLGEALDQVSGGSDCFFLSSFGHPQIAYASGCRGGRLRSDSAQNSTSIRAAMSQGLDVYLLAANSKSVDDFDDGWVCDPVEGLAETSWLMCSQPADSKMGVFG